MTHTHWTIPIAAVGALLIPGSSARAQDGDAILARVDSVATAPRDMEMLERMTLVDADGSTRERAVRVYQQGPERRLVRFEDPADVRDVGFLRLAADRMYLYLPAFRRVRRIASSISNEDFLGTDFTYEDLSQTTYADDYRVTGSDEGSDGYTLTLEPKSGADVSYTRLVMRVDKESWVITGIDYYDGAQHVKTLSESGLRQQNGYWYAERIEMQSRRNGHRTVLELEDVRFDAGLSDELFSERALKRGGRGS